MKRNGPSRKYRPGPTQNPKTHGERRVSTVTKISIDMMFDSVCNCDSCKKNRELYSARVDYDEVADILGFTKEEVGILTVMKKLVPLGKPATKAPRYFHRDEILALGHSRDFLNKSTLALAAERKRRREELQKLPKNKRAADDQDFEEAA